jgi:hypothetical protein
VNGEVSKPSLEFVIFWKWKDFTLLLYLVNILEVLKTIYVDVLNVVLKNFNLLNESMKLGKPQKINP